MPPLVTIVGGGIAGLSAALAFAQIACRVHVLESSDTLGDIGAGLQLSPNVTRLLKALGLAHALSATMVEPESLTLSSGLSLRRLCRIPAADFARQRWNAPYGVIHRADLHGLLAKAVDDHPACSLHLGETVSAESEAALSARLAKKAGREPDLIVGADGVWSGIRNLVPGPAAARFSGSVAWRGIARQADFDFISNPDSINAFLAPHTHLVTYPLARPDAINVVAVTPGHLSDRNWDGAGDAGQLQALFSGWHEDIVSSLGRLSWRQWPLFEVRRTCFRAGTKTVLIGDAAHAMTPHAAQGAAMAIEDACALAACFDVSGRDAEPTIDRFEALRRRRIARVRRRGDFNKFIYHARGPIRIGRDVVLCLRPPEKLAGDLDWLYGYDASDLSPN